MMTSCHTCPRCDGAGTVWNRILRVRETCPRCGGTGSGLAPMRRTPLRRRPNPDRVTVEVRAAVMVRDRHCFLWRMDAGHSCRDQWGNPHRPDDFGRLTVDHVHDHAGGTKGKRAPSDAQHLVLMCYAGNVGAPSRDVRQSCRSGHVEAIKYGPYVVRFCERHKHRGDCGLDDRDDNYVPFVEAGSKEAAS